MRIIQICYKKLLTGNFMFCAVAEVNFIQITLIILQLGQQSCSNNLN